MIEHTYPRDNTSSLSPSTATKTSFGDALNTPLSTQLETGIQTPVGDAADSQVTSLQNHGSRQIPTLKKVLGVNRK